MNNKIKDFTNKKCCLTCDGFCWWDGDYCCTQKMDIHQFGYSNGNWFNEDIDNTMQTSETCKDYEYTHMTHDKYTEFTNGYIKEYKKFKEWDRLCKQLEDHVSDKSGLYKKFIAIGIVRLYDVGDYSFEY